MTTVGKEYQKWAMRRVLSRLVPRGMALHTRDVSRAVGHFSSHLTVLQHFPEALHHFMVCMVKRISTVRKQFHGLSDPARLVNAALFSDGQMHGQVQKRIFPTGLNVGHGAQRCIDVRKITGILRVFVHPLTCYYFDSFQRLSRAGFGVTGTKKSAYIGLRGAEHGARVPRC